MELNVHGGSGGGGPTVLVGSTQPYYRCGRQGEDLSSLLKSCLVPSGVQSPTWCKCLTPALCRATLPAADRVKWLSSQWALQTGQRQSSPPQSRGQRLMAGSQAESMRPSLAGAPGVEAPSLTWPDTTWAPSFLPEWPGSL